jgi:hypothetical protein
MPTLSVGIRASLLYAKSRFGVLKHSYFVQKLIKRSKYIFLKLFKNKTSPTFYVSFGATD